MLNNIDRISHKSYHLSDNMSFNAQEILARLRAQSTNIPESIPVPPPAPEPVLESPGKSIFSAASNSKPIISTKVIKAPAALTLTPSQVKLSRNL